MSEDKCTYMEGDVILVGLGACVLTDIPAHFMGDVCNWSEMVWGEVRILGRKDAFRWFEYALDTSYLMGKYIVTRVSREGGGYSEHDGAYPSEWHVYAFNVEHQNIKIVFREKENIDKIKAAGKAEMKWAVKE